VHPAAIAQLRCPVCRGPLRGPAPGESALRCPRGHSFDLARQGYVDLSGGPVTHDGDAAEMVAARERVLAAGHFRAVSEAVVAQLAGYPQLRFAVEVGAGTGYYLARVLDARPELAGLALDVSKPALRRAARAHPRMAAVRADVWRGLPIADGGADLVLDVFAPRAGAEFARILAPGGVLLVVTAEPDHLAELVAAVGMLGVDPAKRERLAGKLAPWFVLAAEHTVRAPLRLGREDAEALVRMGPSGHHLDAVTLTSRIHDLGVPVAATLSVRVTVWRPGTLAEWPMV
jgi:23S rRNA (guanine745-N1)-methyltransferase